MSPKHHSSTTQVHLILQIFFYLAGIFLLFSTACSSDSPPLPGCEACPQTCEVAPDGQSGTCPECLKDIDCNKDARKIVCVDKHCLECKPKTTRPCLPKGAGACIQGLQTCDNKGVWGECKDWKACKDGEKCVEGKCVTDCPDPAPCQPGDKKCTTDPKEDTGRYVSCIKNSKGCYEFSTKEESCDLHSYCYKGACHRRDCPEGYNKCKDKCVDLQNDHNNCGKCGNACSDDQVCANGKCGTVCPKSTPTICDGGCVNTQNNPNHCGKCGNKCATGQSCNQGVCVCPPDKLTCGQKCVDPKTDRLNCGGCNVKCSEDKQCRQGVCVCSKGMLNCSDVCIDPKTNPENCGSCGNKCLGGKQCVAGQCQCLKGQLFCNGKCVDPQTNINHCGTCNNQCLGGKLCQAGKCACFQGQIFCSNKCTDPKIDPMNCGKCGNTCKKGFVCNNGQCKQACPTGTPDLCNNRCVDLQTDPNNCGKCGNKCTGDKICNQGQCLCPTGKNDCNGQCVDLQKDRLNCGKCGNSCKKYEFCTTGKCSTVCPPNVPNLCNKICVDLQTDPNNCGQCGVKCSGGKKCDKGVCRCSTGESECNGICKDLQTDSQNCGTCGTTCKKGFICKAGQCVSYCPAGTPDFCNNSCVDLQTNPNHCGKCGHTCPTGHSCIKGKCELRCPSPLTKCGTTCVNTDFNRYHCGKCGNTCKSGYVCNKGSCELSCQQGLSVCNDKCVNLKNDNQNCGKCGTTCKQGEICSNGKCQLNCQTGQTACNGQCVDLQKDPNNCGKCGTQCKSYQVCVKGKCQGNAFPDSKILNTSQMDTINKWIGQPSQKWVLCYRLTTHGSSTSTFHARCDNRGPTVTIALLNKGTSRERIIGGYTEIPWGGRSGRYMTAAKSFLFSITNNFKHSLRSTPQNNAIYNHTSYGPTFGGGHDFVSGYNNYIGSNAYCNLGSSYNCRTGSLGSSTCRNDFCGTYYPSINELEVYVRDTTKAPYFPDSTIIDSNNMSLINNWVGSSQQRWVLCYKKSLHGSNVSSFHNNCDLRGPTITIASLNKGSSNARIVGGYAAASWGLTSGSYYQTNNSFLFSITNTFKHSLYRNASNSLYMRNDYGPTFGGGHDFYTGSNTIGSGAYCHLGHAYTCRIGSYGSSTCRNDFCGTYRPTITDLEVYFMRSNSKGMYQNSILLNNTQMQQINSWIGTPSQRWRLCYRASRDGYSSNTFHRLCDNRGPSVFVASLATGRLIGGYANQSWGTVNNGYFGNSNSFLFSLTNNYKHSWYRYGYYLYSGNSYGPIFGGGHDAYVQGNMRTLSCNLGYSYRCRVGSYGSSTCRNDFAGGSSVTINDLEVFVKY